MCTSSAARTKGQRGWAVILDDDIGDSHGRRRLRVGLVVRGDGVLRVDDGGLDKGGAKGAGRGTVSLVAKVAQAVVGVADVALLDEPGDVARYGQALLVVDGHVRFRGDRNGGGMGREEGEELGLHCVW